MTLQSAAPLKVSGTAAFGWLCVELFPEVLFQNLTRRCSGEGIYHDYRFGDLKFPHLTLTPGDELFFRNYLCSYGAL